MEKKPMIKFETAQGKYLAVDVPEGVSDFHIIHAGTQLAWFTPKYKRIPIPPGTYSIVGIAGKLGEGVCAGIVDNYKNNADKYAYYENGIILDTHFCFDAIPSLASLLRSHNIPSSALIIKIEE